jgi:hypothetical protein
MENLGPLKRSMILQDLKLEIKDDLSIFLTPFQFLSNSCLSCCIPTHHQTSSLSIFEPFVEGQMVWFELHGMN